jgi:hypothetical protein
MATTIIESYVVGGGKRLEYGSFTTSGTTGTIVTSLQYVDFIKLTGNDTSVLADQPTINTALPASTGTIGYTITSGKGGYYWALGI